MKETETGRLKRRRRLKRSKEGSLGRSLSLPASPLHLDTEEKLGVIRISVLRIFIRSS